MTEIYDFKPKALLAERPPEVALPYDIQLCGATDSEGYFHLHRSLQSDSASSMERRSVESSANPQADTQ